MNFLNLASFPNPKQLFHTAFIAVALSLSPMPAFGAPAVSANATPPSAPAIATTPAIATATATAPATPPSPDTASVYTLSTGIDATVISVGALGTALPYVFAHGLITRRCPCDPSEVNPIDRPSIGNANRFLDSVSDVTAGLAVLAPIAFDWVDTGNHWNRVFFEDMVIYAEVLAVNGALVSMAKYAAQRPLPQVYADPTIPLANEPGGYRSFYSGHASLVFSALTSASMTWHLRHGATLWPWLVTAGAGVTVAIERVAAGRHFPTDVTYGALAGVGVGTLIPLLHRRFAGDDGSDARSRASVSPITGDGRLGLAWNYRL